MEKIDLKKELKYLYQPSAKVDAYDHAANAMMANKALHLTAIPLCSIAAGYLGR